MSSTGEAWYCYEWAIKDSPLERNDAVEPDMAVKTSGTGMAHTDRISASYASSRMLLAMPGNSGAAICSTSTSAGGKTDGRVTPAALAVDVLHAPPTPSWPGQPWA